MNRAEIAVRYTHDMMSTVNQITPCGTSTPGEALEAAHDLQTMLVEIVNVIYRSVTAVLRKSYAHSGTLVDDERIRGIREGEIKGRGVLLLGLILTARDLAMMYVPRGAQRNVLLTNDEDSVERVEDASGIATGVAVDVAAQYMLEMMSKYVATGLQRMEHLGTEGDEVWLAMRTPIHLIANIIGVFDTDVTQPIRELMARIRPDNLYPTAIDELFQGEHEKQREYMGGELRRMAHEEGVEELAPDR